MGCKAATTVACFFAVFTYRHADAGKSVKSMARGGQGLPREKGGEPLDLLDAGTSRKMVKHAAARGAAAAAAAAGPASQEEDEFERADDGKMIIRVCKLPCFHESQSQPFP